MSIGAGFCADDADVGIEITNDGNRVVGKPSKKNQWLGVRGRPGILRGCYQFEIQLESVCLLRVGWSADCSNRSLGLDAMSFGYGGTAMKSHNRKFEKYGEEFHQSSSAVITCVLDRRDPKAETISYFIDGRDLGVAFQLPSELAGIPLFPALSGKDEWSALCWFTKLTFPQECPPLAEALATHDAVTGPLVLGLSSGDADANIQIDSSGSHALCTPEAARNAWFGTRGRPGVLHGRYQYEIELKSECLLRVGWSALRTKRAVGNDALSFGYGGTGKKSSAGKFSDYGQPFERKVGSVISCLIDREGSPQTISFCLDGQDMGVAFDIPLDCAEVPLFPTICGKGAWEAACRYTDFAFPQAGYLALADALAARDAIAGHGLAGTVVAPKGTLVTRDPAVQRRDRQKEQLEQLMEADCAPVDGVVPGRQVVLHVHSGPWQGWYACEVVDCDPQGCYLRHESDGYTENVPWAFLNNGKYSMELLGDSQQPDVDVWDLSPLAAVAPSNAQASPESGSSKSDSLRLGRLRVHSDLGAGLTLVMCEVGYFVSKVDEPGQPDLRKGDAIVAIGKTTLLGLEEAELECRFGEEFSDSAIIVKGNYLSLRQLSFKDIRQEVDHILKQPLPMHPKLISCGGGDGYDSAVVEAAQTTELPVLRLAPVLTRSLSTRSNDGASFLKRGRLNVDPRSGQAGLELSACPAGYLVNEISSWPGQRDLDVGDAIVAIGGTLLLGLTEEEVEDRFGDAYCDGAIFVAGPQRELTAWPFEVVQREVELLLMYISSSESRLLTERARTY